MPHTLHTLAAALRGMPRDAPILVETQEGLRRVSLVSATYVREQDGGLESGSKGEGGQYAIVLHLEPRDGAGSP
jgi:hypothetical protein